MLQPFKDIIRCFNSFIELILKSYQALWMRIQNEIEGARFNRFADIVDLDRLIDEVYTPEIMVEMSARLASVINRLDEGARPITLSTAEELHARARFGKVSLPRQVNRTTVREGGAGRVMRFPSAKPATVWITWLC